MVKLEVDHVSKRYWLEREGTEVPALVDVSLSVADGEFMAIVGPSGCGKTSLLNIVAGLLPYDEGSVSIDGRKDRGTGHRPRRGVPALQPAAVADHRGQRPLRDGIAAALRQSHHGGAHRILHQAGGPERIRAALSRRSFRAACSSA